MLEQQAIGHFPWVGGEKTDFENCAVARIARTRHSENTISESKLATFRELFSDTSRKCLEAAVREKRVTACSCRENRQSMRLDHTKLYEKQQYDTCLTHLCQASMLSKCSHKYHNPLMYQYIRHCYHYHCLKHLQINQHKKYQYMHQISHEVTTDQFTSDIDEKNHTRNDYWSQKSSSMSFTVFEGNYDKETQSTVCFQDTTSTYTKSTSFENIRLRRRMRSTFKFALKESGLLDTFQQTANLCRKGRELQKELDMLTRHTGALVAAVLKNPQNQMLTSPPTETTVTTTQHGENTNETPIDKADIIASEGIESGDTQTSSSSFFLNQV